MEAIYAKTLGFHVAAEMDYAMEYDHDDIAANHGKPKVVFMVDSAAAERRKFDDYDAAVAYQRGATSAASAASASKVVDENGEPLVVWHGTDADFTVFDRAKTRATISSISSTVKNLEALVADYRAKGELDARQKSSSTGLNASSNPFAMIWTCSNMRLTIPSVFFRPKKSFR